MLGSFVPGCFLKLALTQNSNKIPVYKFTTIVFSRFLSSKVPKKKPVRIESEKAQAKHFVDFKKLKVYGGPGGDGMVSFMSLYANEFAGPDGGNGGNGGHIVFQADESVNSLSKLKSIYRGQPGQKGKSKHCNGKNAESTFIKVPVGTFFRNEDGEVIAELENPGSIFVGGRGGAGGRGNYFFLSNENRAPRTYEEGGPGEEKTVYAELRVIAHFGLVGFPNAGKSSLLRCLTNAKPKVGFYPFTTLFPHVGIIKYDDYEQVSVADVPGLIEGAHQNRGLGYSFLRHMEQCHCLIYVLDLSFDSTMEQLEMLKTELEHYKPGLSQKPHIIVGNKIDLEMSRKNYERLKEKMKDECQIFPISAKDKTNVAELTALIRKIYDSSTAANVVPTPTSSEDEDLSDDIL